MDASYPQPPGEPYAPPPDVHVATSPRPLPVPKEFACVFPGCTKSFTRAEHLHRHALNHNEGNGTACHRCSAVFKRRDLLERHMARHKEKDDEAGGEGLGRLLTRKRLWRDSTGAIVSKKRPEHEKERKHSSTINNSRVDPVLLNLPNHSVEPNGTYALAQQIDLPNSPRSLDPASHAVEVTEPFARESFGGSETGHGPRVSKDPWPVPNGTMPFQEIETDSYEFLDNSSWGSQSILGDNSDASRNENFAINSRNTSNMPFVGLDYYAWLFEQEIWTVTAPDPTSNHSGHHPPPLAYMGESSRGNGPELGQPGFGHYSAPRLPPISQEMFNPALRTGSPSITSSHGVPAFAEFLAMSQNPEFNSSPNPNRFLRENSVGSSSESPNPGRGLGAGPRSDRFILTPPESRTGPDFYRASQLPKRPRRLPVVGEVAREHILRFVDVAQPKTQDGSKIYRDDSSLSTATLQHFSDLFFRRFNTAYPLFHQPTFDPATVDPLLLCAILQLGATYSTKDDHIFAISLHNSMRSQIHAHPAFGPRPPLCLLQTMTLVECFAKSRAGQLQHDMSGLFHVVLINLIRSSDFLSARCQNFNDLDDLDYRWRAEVEAEQRRRIALLCFMWDTQDAVLFAQSLHMSTAELKLSLPWDTALWEADTAEYWHSLKASQRPQMQYLSVLKAYINPASNQRPQLLNGLSRVLILHGIMNIAWDLSKRDQASLGFSLPNKPETWQSRIMKSYDAWKTDFESFTTTTLSSLSDHQNAKDDFQKFSTATLAIYHTALIVLNTDIIDLQIFAGARHIVGHAVHFSDRERSKQRIGRWAEPGSTASATAVSHAALLLRDGVRKLHNWDAGDVLHYSWCLYLATLTCWAFQSVGHDGTHEGGDSGNDEEAEWDSRAEMNALVSAITRSKPEELWKIRGKYRAGDLPRVVGKLLSAVRWAVVQEGVVVLRGLTR